MHSRRPQLDRHLAEGLQPRGVRGECRDQHPPLGAANDVVETNANRRLGTRCLVIENIGRIAHQREHALVADRAEFGRGRRHAKLRRIVDLPVAGVENPAVRGIDHQRVALWNRVRQRQIAKAERAELEAALIIDDVELDLIL